MRRHDLVTLSPNGWRTLLDARPDVAENSLASQWGERGWPLVVRRFMPGETLHGVPLGLPLPPTAGKRRFSVWASADDVVAFSPPPLLDSVIGISPPHWQPTLQQIAAWAAQQNIEARVFGGLAWAHVTGLAYISATSDLDLLLSLPADRDIERLSADLLELESSAPMRLDGEFVRDDGAGVNWKELLQSGKGQVLLKTLNAATLISTADFVRGVSSS